jgi:hypothetical protein
MFWTVYSIMQYTMALRRRQEGFSNHVQNAVGVAPPPVRKRVSSGAAGAPFSELLFPGCHNLFIRMHIK